MEHEVTGLWTGQYAYPGDGEGVGFTAALHESDGRFTGSISETDRFEGELSSVVEGRRTGSAVRFTKFYETGSADFDIVIYEGAISADGSEIHGRWSVPGDWSGPFLMVRTPEREIELSRTRIAQV